MMAILRFFVRLFQWFTLLGVLMALIGTGLGLGGFFLLEHLIRGEQVVMPRVTGMAEADAVKALMEKGLMVEYPLKTVYNNQYAAGFILDQHPQPLNTVKKGRMVQLTLSSGPQRVQIPSLVGRREGDIFSDLRGTGLEVGEIARVYHPEQEADVILAQDPPPGSRIVLARKINLLVSQGPQSPSYVMPNLIGMYESNMQNTLRQTPLLFTEESVAYETTLDTDEWNRVLRQRPEGGAPVTADELVQVWIGSSTNMMTKGRLVEIEFDDIPTQPVGGALSLIVWDERSRITATPVVLSVAPERTGYVKKPLQLFGDALVEVGVVFSQRPLLQYRSLDRQFNPAGS